MPVSCFEANGTPGCDIEECETAVCGIDPFCCEFFWDGLCAMETEQFPDQCVVPEGLALTKEVDQSVAYLGDSLIYTITVENNSSTDATNVVVTDTLPVGVNTGCNQWLCRRSRWRSCMLARHDHSRHHSHVHHRSHD